MTTQCGKCGCWKESKDFGFRSAPYQDKLRMPCKQCRKETYLKAKRHARRVGIRRKKAKVDLEQRLMPWWKR